MSANNYVLIEDTGVGAYDVSVKDADTGEVLYTVGNNGDLKEAIKMGQSERTEYGLHFNI